MDISRNKLKLIRSLGEKKYRKEHGLFIVEREKILLEMLNSNQPVTMLLACKEWLKTHEGSLTGSMEVFEVSEDNLKKASPFSNPPQVIAVCKKNINGPDMESIPSQLSLVLDCIQDPGNVGTILRIADWFGIPNVICSKHTADVYNPKVIQASMGSFIRLNILYCDLDGFFSSLKDGLNIYGTFPEGKNIYSEELSPAGIIVMGNESKGIDPALEKYINFRISIPGYPLEQQGAESLNVSVAAGIICSEFRRRIK